MNEKPLYRCSCGTAAFIAVKSVYLDGSEQQGPSEMLCTRCGRIHETVITGEYYPTTRFVFEGFFAPDRFVFNKRVSEAMLETMRYGLYGFPRSL
jgi:hypothetical protein